MQGLADTLQASGRDSCALQIAQQLCTDSLCRRGLEAFAQFIATADTCGVLGIQLGKIGLTQRLAQAGKLLIGAYRH